MYAYNSSCPLASTNSSLLPFERVLLFGDFLASTAETNDLYSNGTFPPSPPFSNRRYSDGPVWTEYLNDTGLVDIINFEVGGSTSSNAISQGATGIEGRYTVVVPPSADEQVDAYIDDRESWSALNLNRTLFSVSSINDIFNDPAASPATTVAVWRAAMGRLKTQIGARNFLLFDWYDLGRTPLALQGNQSVKENYRRYSYGLKTSTLELQTSWLRDYPTDTVRYYSVQDTLDKLSFFGSAGEYGFGEFAYYGRCVVNFYISPNWTRCNNASEYVWYDEYHPSTKVHSIIADDIATVLRSTKSIPSRIIFPYSKPRKAKPLQNAPNLNIPSFGESVMLLRLNLT